MLQLLIHWQIVIGAIGLDARNIAAQTTAACNNTPESAVMRSGSAASRGGGGMIALILVAALALYAGDTQAECINPADTIVVNGVQTRFECNPGEDIDITFDLDGFTISTTMDQEP